MAAEASAQTPTALWRKAPRTPADRALEEFALECLYPLFSSMSWTSRPSSTRRANTRARRRPSLRKTLLSGKRSVTLSCVNSHTNAAAQRQSLTRPAIVPPHQHVFDVLPPPAQQFNITSF